MGTRNLKGAAKGNLKGAAKGATKSPEIFPEDIAIAKVVRAAVQCGKAAQSNCAAHVTFGRALMSASEGASDKKGRMQNLVLAARMGCDRANVVYPGHEIALEMAVFLYGPKGHPQWEGDLLRMSVFCARRFCQLARRVYEGSPLFRHEMDGETGKVSGKAAAEKMIGEQILADVAHDGQRLGQVSFGARWKSAPAVSVVRLTKSARVTILSQSLVGDICDVIRSSPAMLALYRRGLAGEATILDQVIETTAAAAAAAK